MTAICDGALTSMALCWRVERADGAGLALTSHDRPVVRDGIAYKSSPGMSPAAISRSLGLEPHSGEARGAISTNAIAEADLILGRWDGAKVRLSAVDWDKPDRDSIDLLAGELGTVSIEGDAFTADLQGASAKLDRPVCPATSAECRANFGDKRCRVDLAGRTIQATVTAVDGGQLSLSVALDDQFLLGRLRYLSGANCGLQSAMIAISGITVTVRDLPRAPVEPGCQVEIRHGCDKRFTTCAERFGNAANFRGEPHLPGNDLLTRYPGA